ncbi:TIGR01666 family membrane protein [Rouxiella badensis]|uniref:YccS family putative transporter n=1 Tax=Rouxiella badensis TaxID=1646377 RepID=UPI001D13B488|nr:YccS family putative transporter [Rouxiella badensis]MCC3717592.1 TIGR01666 family membrane protein [Rouxiella badensis]MCC3727464.1 TIGR01666 family membrane protein [Rouxiella badensis]MCC3732591.1 TIGR01666 family membrane protein [Rouxiella badensis]MCC3740296.1 TIGR01666 family membrane protein [Rouxiella badensis]MCC3758437.1 TIGR01666 family membrane protein [Rouxiella badensis]
MLSIAPGLRRYAYNSNLLYSIRIFIALAGTVAGPWLLSQPKLTIPLTLGVVAAGLSDLDDRLAGRLRNLLITLVSFFVASVSVVLLFPHPWLFAVGLAVSTCGFILLGALGQRYATIAFGALLIAIYTMLGINNVYQVWYEQSALLLTGTVWYYLLTLTGHVLLPIRPLQDNISRCYQKLAVYLDAKSTLFDPDQEGDNSKQLVNLAMANGQLVTTLNETKTALQSRLKGDRGQKGTRRTLQYYFVAQDIHERASSIHVNYQRLSEQFHHTDILFRLQRLMSMQSVACQQLSQCILYRQKYQHNPLFERAFVRLGEAIERQMALSPDSRLIKALRHLIKNLRAIDAQLSNIESEQALSEAATAGPKTFADDKLTGFQDIWLRISRHLTPKSALFRHAVRMSAVLLFGYAFIQISGLSHGYWILLTSLFVCQPNYSATRRRLALRVVGTLAGVALGMPILYFIPSLEGQMILIVICGMLFFTFRSVQYAHATMFITLLALLLFNLMGQGFEVAIPRIIDTLIGCLIAWFAVSFIWPDWRFRQLPTVVNKTFYANCRYLDAILVQYHQGKDNGLEYRIARRDAHNCDAELASVVSNMTSEKDNDRDTLDAAFRLLCLNHTMLSYISALGAHREKLEDSETLTLLDDATRYVDSALHHEGTDDSQVKELLHTLSERIQAKTTASDTKEQLVLQQIRLLLEHIPEMTSLNNKISPAGKGPNV